MLHGILWEFVRNNAFNTKNNFATTIPVLRQNQFGAAVGGPVIFPHYNGKNAHFSTAATRAHVFARTRFKAARSHPQPQNWAEHSRRRRRSSTHNTTAYAVQPTGMFGNSQRNSVFGPGYEDLDVALMKDFRITENTRIEFRGEAFNSPNRVNFANPDGRVGDGVNFGRITAASDPRLVQLAGKLYF